MVAPTSPLLYLLLFRALDLYGRGHGWQRAASFAGGATGDPIGKAMGRCAVSTEIDVGLYPGDITVGDDGVLRLEIGGSSLYTLSAAGSDVAVPALVEVPATQESHELKTPAEEDAGTADSIPILHIVLFAGGFVLASEALIAMHVKKKRAVST